MPNSTTSGAQARTSSRVRKGAHQWLKANSVGPDDPVTARENRAIYRAIRILEKRLTAPGEALNSPEAVRAYLRLNLAQEEREVFLVLFLDAQNRLIAAEPMFTGTVTQTAVYPREIVKHALQHNAVSVIFAHNHPSGIPEPSNADRELTVALKKALLLIDVRTLDHFIVGGDRVMSFAERLMI